MVSWHKRPASISESTQLHARHRRASTVRGESCGSVLQLITKGSTLHGEARDSVLYPLVVVVCNRLCVQLLVQRASVGSGSAGEERLLHAQMHAQDMCFSHALLQPT
jgi:hypothetical protein